MRGRECVTGRRPNGWEIEHNLAKVGVVGSNPIARSKNSINYTKIGSNGGRGCFLPIFGEAWGKQPARNCARP